jgi:protein MpaA
VTRGLLAAACLVVAGCSAGGSAVSTSAVATTSSPSGPASTSTSSTSTSSTSTTAAERNVTEVIGTSVEGRPIEVIHVDPASVLPGSVPVLVVGVIHGDENDGLAVLEDLAAGPAPSGVDLWLMPAMNPDGLAADARHNARGVDLNRNFPHDWTAIAGPGNWEYSGTGPASEPETQAFMAFVDRLQPALTLWYHQWEYRISPSWRSDGPLRERYAQLTGLPYLAVTGGTYTGVAATWTRQSHPGAMSFIVELGETLSAAEAAVHADAVREVATMARDVATNE